MDDDKPNDKPDARAALAAAAEAGDPNAKRALAAWDNDKPKAEDEGQPKKDDDDKEKEGKAKAASAAAALAASTETASLSALQSSVTALATSVQALTAKDTAAAAAERATFLATRPDLAKAVVDGLASLPLETLKLAVAAIPVAANPLAPPAGDPKLRGAGAAGVVAVPEAAGMPAAMAAVMGLAQPEKYGVVNDGSLQIFGVPVK